MNFYIYKYICIYIKKTTHTNKHTHICMQMYTYTYIYICIYHLYTYIYVYICMYASTSNCIYVQLYMHTYIYIYMAVSHLRGYAGVSIKGSGRQNAEGVRRESEWRLLGSRSESSCERSDRPAAQRRASGPKCCTYHGLKTTRNTDETLHITKTNNCS